MSNVVQGVIARAFRTIQSWVRYTVEPYNRRDG